MSIEPDYQRPPGTPEPEGGTMVRSPFPGWLRRSAAEGTNAWRGGQRRVREFKMFVLLHQLAKGRKTT